jgi:hypothetical protein
VVFVFLHIQQLYFKPSLTRHPERSASPPHRVTAAWSAESKSLS